MPTCTPDGVPDGVHDCYVERMQLASGDISPLSPAVIQVIQCFVVNLPLALAEPAVGCIRNQISAGKK